MSRIPVLIAFVLVLIVASALPVWAGDPVDAALAYLASQQQADGGFTGGYGGGSDLGLTCDVILAVAAGGRDVGAWVSGSGRSPLDYLHAQVARGAVGESGMKAKVALALLASGQDPTAFAGHDLIAELEAGYDWVTGRYGGNVFDQALAMVALFNAGRWIPDQAAQYLLDKQCADGAWALFGDTAAGAGDTNTTALVIQALLATGHRDEIGEGFDYLRRVQNTDGGFPYQNPSAYGTQTDANSTAYVYQALLAAGAPLGEWMPGVTDPLGALVALHDPASGAFFWQAAVSTPNVLATAQAIPAVAGYTFVHLPRVDTVGVPSESREPEGRGAADAAGAPEVALLSESGGVDALPVCLMGLGVAALAAGLAGRADGCAIGRT